MQKLLGEDVAALKRNGKLWDAIYGCEGRRNRLEWISDAPESGWRRPRALGCDQAMGPETINPNGWWFITGEASKLKWCQNNIGEPGKDYHSVIVVVAKYKQNGGRAGPGRCSSTMTRRIFRGGVKREASACIIRGAMQRRCRNCSASES